MIPLHPKHLEALYDCLREFPPFKRWKLPPAEEVHFSVTRAKDRFGSYCKKENGHHITASSESVGHFYTLSRLVAHEMIHLAQEVAGVSSSSQHNADFKRRAALVAKVHGFDPKEL
jgi:SprT-like family protein